LPDAFSPVLSGFAFGAAALGLPFFIAGGIKLVYDGPINAAFRNLRPPEEVALLQARQGQRNAASQRAAQV
jgi:hypothetical protein